MPTKEQPEKDGRTIRRARSVPFICNVTNQAGPVQSARETPLADRVRCQEVPPEADDRSSP